MGIRNILNKFLYGGENTSEYVEDTVETEGYTDEDSADPAFTPNETTTAAGGNVNMASGDGIHMVKVIRPDSLEAVTEIADYLLDRNSVILNLEDASKETANRLIDFLRGVTYAINGTFEQTSKYTFFATPNNVNVDGGKAAEAAAAAADSGEAL